MTPDEYELAACRLGDAHLFDGYDSHRANDALRVLAAVAICRGCPLRDRCLTEAVTERATGVRGGRLLEDGKPRPINLTRHRSFAYRPRPQARGLDELAIDAIMTGQLRIPLGTQSAELIEAVRRLAALGRDDQTIAGRMGRTERAICKMRSRHGIPAGSGRNSRKKVA